MTTTYALQQMGTIMYDATKKPYVMKVRDMAESDKPREKLMQHGATALDITELLAVVLGVGTRKEEVMAMSSRILKEYGTKALSCQKSPQQLADDLDIPLGKATQIIACAELGRRFFDRNENGNALLRTAEDVFNYVGDMRNLPKEHLRGLYLNARYKVIHDEVISIGTVNTSIIHPREVFKPALEYCAAAVIVVHNHPSGDVQPSPADIAVTTQLKAAADILNIDFLDHVIVTKDAFSSVILD